MRARRAKQRLQLRIGAGQLRHRRAGQTPWPVTTGDLPAVRQRWGQRAGRGLGSRHRAQESPEATLHRQRCALLLVTKDGGRLRDPALPPPGRRAITQRWPPSPGPAGTAGAATPGARPPCCAPLQTGSQRREAGVACAPRGVQGWAARLRAGTPHGRPGAPHDFGCRSTPSCAAPCHGAYPTPTLFPRLLGLAVGGIYRLRGRAAIREGTPWGWASREPLRNGTADGQWAVRNAADHGHGHGVTHGPPPDGQGGWGRGQHTAGQEAVPGEAVPAAPQHCRADVRGEAIEGPEAPALGLGAALQTGVIGAREGAPCVGALEQRHDRPRGNGHPTGAPVWRDFGPPPVLRVAQGPDARHDSEATRRLGPGEPSRFCRSVGAAELWTGPVETAPAVPREMPHVVQGRERTLVMRGGPHPLPAAGTMTPKRWEGARGGGGRTRRRTCPGESSLLSDSSWYQERATDV